MRFIKKDNEPIGFSAWKAEENEDWQPTWNNLSDDPNHPTRKPKTALHEALLREQGFICCYCGGQIDRRKSHIEHLQPRQRYPELALAYSNLLASCPGYAEDEELKPSDAPRPPSAHCGHKKGQWYDPDLMVSPLNKNCADYFRYTGSGEVNPTHEPDMRLAAQTTIDKLGLNLGSLPSQRRQAIAEAEDTLLGQETGEFTVEDIQKLIQQYDQRDARGKFPRFCAAVVYILKEYAIGTETNR